MITNSGQHKNSIVANNWFISVSSVISNLMITNLGNGDIRQYLIHGKKFGNSSTTSGTITISGRYIQLTTISGNLCSGFRYKQSVIQ